MQVKCFKKAIKTRTFKKVLLKINKLTNKSTKIKFYIHRQICLHKKRIVTELGETAVYQKIN